MNEKHKYSYHFTLIFTMILLCIIIHSLYDIFAEEEPEKEIQISAIIEDSSSPRWNSFLLGMEHAAKDFHADLTIVPTGRYESGKDGWDLVNKKIEDGADGIIFAPESSEDIPEFYENLMGESKIIFVENEMQMDENTFYPSIMMLPDYKEMGKRIVEDIKEDFGADLKNKKFYLLTSCSKQIGVRDSMEYVKSKLLDEGCIFQKSIDIDLEDNKNYMKHGQADIIVAFDDYTLSYLAESIKSQRINHISLYGIGLSETNVNYLEERILKNLIVVNEFQMGYESLSILAESIRNHSIESKKYTVDFMSVRPEEIHNPKIEKLLFPIIQ
ncbi:MAG: substrate-binding domain-containing protein [Eubacteriales bacterium]|nr:substrate-binding domain-containing protein [Eubacteriales bacterium]